MKRDPKARPQTNRPGDRTRSIVAGVVVVMILTGLALFAAARSPSSSRAATGGTRALRRFLAELGVQATDGNFPPGAGEGTFVLMADFRTPSQDTAILDWVRQGGRLVVLDPTSELAARLGTAPRAAIGGLPESTSIEAGCDAPEARAAGTIEVASTNTSLTTDVAAFRSCYQRAGGAFELAETLGTGTALVLGGSSPFTDALLDKADNAAFAAQLMRAEPVVFGSASLPGLPATGEGSQKGVWGSLPGAARAVLLELGVAVLAFALVRARRLGRPVLEDPLAPIPAGELVVATGRLYRRARTREFAADLLRTSTITQLARRLGLPPGTTPQQVGSAVAATTSMPEDRIARALAGPAPVNDEELIALGRELEDVRRALGSPLPAPSSTPNSPNRTLMEAPL